MGLPYNTFIVLMGVTLLGATAGMIGCFAVLRRRALLGDATAHAALPGLCAAFLLGGGRSMPAMLLGALVSGLTGIGVLTLLRRWTRLKEDAGLAIVLGVFYALGVFLLSLIIQRGGASGLESFLLGKTAGMIAQDVYWLLALGLLTLATILLAYKEFKLTAFDADFAQAQGWPVLTLDYALNFLVVLAVIVGLPAVGVLLMAALLIIPAAAARFWTERLTNLLILAAGIGVIGGLAGTTLSNYVERFPTGPAIILACAALFLVSVLSGPRRGLLARYLAHRRFQKRLLTQQLLCKLHEVDKTSFTTEELKGDGRADWASLARLGVLERQGNVWMLTSTGQEKAAAAARRQQQAEAYLHCHPEMAASLAEWFWTDEDNR